MLELLGTSSAVQTPDRDFASGPHWGLSSPSPWQVCRRGEGWGEHPLSWSL